MCVCFFYLHSSLIKIICCLLTSLVAAYQEREVPGTNETKMRHSAINSLNIKQAKNVNKDNSGLKKHILCVIFMHQTEIALFAGYLLKSEEKQLLVFEFF